MTLPLSCERAVDGKKTASNARSVKKIGRGYTEGCGWRRCEPRHTCAKKIHRPSPSRNAAGSDDVMSSDLPIFVQTRHTAFDSLTTAIRLATAWVAAQPHVRGESRWIWA